MAAGLLTVSAVDALAVAVRQRVLDVQIGAGTILTESEVALSNDVSRPTAKGAITSLVHAGVLHRHPNKSARVPALTHEHVNDLFLARAPIELAALRRIGGPRPPTAAAHAVRDLASIPASAVNSRFVEADIRFHRALVAAAGSPQLMRLFDLLSSEIHLSMLQSRRILGVARIVVEHRRILDAVERQNSPLAERLMAEHLEGARLALLGTAE